MLLPVKECGPGAGAWLWRARAVLEVGLPLLPPTVTQALSVEQLTKAWAAEYGPRGVRVNAVSPGPTRAEGTAPTGEALDQLVAAGPAGRPAFPEEIAEAIVFLATGRAGFVHGAILPVDGVRAAV